MNRGDEARFTAAARYLLTIIGRSTANLTVTAVGARRRAMIKAESMFRMREGWARPPAILAGAAVLFVAGVAPSACRRNSVAAKPACMHAACEDGFTANVTVASAPMRKGVHRIDITLDGTELGCAFELPPKVANADGSIRGTCQPGLAVILRPQPSGSLEESITVMGTPKSVGITESVDSQPVFEQFATPVYQVAHPNGPGCEPSCRQATAHWVTR